MIYIDELKGAEFWLRGLFTCRTEDWDFIKTVLFAFMQELPYMQAAGLLGSHNSTRLPSGSVIQANRP